MGYSEGSSEMDYYAFQLWFLKKTPSKMTFLKNGYLNHSFITLKKKKTSHFVRIYYGNPVTCYFFQHILRIYRLFHFFCFIIIFMRLFFLICSWWQLNHARISIIFFLLLLLLLLFAALNYPISFAKVFCGKQ